MNAPAFEWLFGRGFDAAGAAPGRVNLIGEHTDYNGGFVMPTALPQRTRVEAAGRDDAVVRVWSALAPEAAPETYELGSEARRGGWIDYVQGATLVLHGKGYDVRGFDARVTSDVPVGAGVSSSAALEVALLRALRTVFGLAFDDLELARLAHDGEVALSGARVGLLDPLACSFARDGWALFIDVRELRLEPLALPPHLELAVVHSGISHRNAEGGYNVRREECERASRLLGVAELRDVTPVDLGAVDALPEPLPRRVRHVVTENARVLEARAALRAGDAATLGRILNEGHASLRDLYEVSLPEIDLLAELCRAQPGVYGARLTGGGFGGSVVVVAARGAAAPAAAAAAGAYAERSGRTPAVLVPRVEGKAA